MTGETTSAEREGRAGRARRWLYVTIGVLAVAVGAVGVFVPGLPTTIFLILASVCFTRSCPWLEERLIRVRLFAPYLRYLDGEPIPRRTRLAAVATMWLFVTVSAVIFWLNDTTWATVAVLAAGVVANCCIMRWRREGSAAVPPVLAVSSPSEAGTCPVGRRAG